MAEEKKKIVGFTSSDAKSLKVIMKAGEYQNRQVGKDKTNFGKAIQFQDGIYQTDDPEEIKLLRNLAKTDPHIWEVK